MSKTILVTGSSRGIGKAVAIRLAASGFAVVVHCRTNISSARSTLEAITSSGGQGRICQFDISNRKETQSAIQKELEAYGPYYGVVYNAGISKDNPFPGLSEMEWDQVIHTNLDGFYNVVQPVTMPMIRAKTGGRIIAMTSISGITGNRGQVNYAASKAGLIGAVKSLAIELAKRKITVNCVAPGLIETDMVEDLPKAEISKQIPLRRFGKPDEVAALVNFLCSEDAAYITRQVISINGGMV